MIAITDVERQTAWARDDIQKEAIRISINQSELNKSSTIAVLMLRAEQAEIENEELKRYKEMLDEVYQIWVRGTSQGIGLHAVMNRYKRATRGLWEEQAK